MAKLFSVKQKEKEYIFKSFDNDKCEKPAKVIFKKFPFADEIFPTANQKNILNSSIVKDFDNSQKSKEKLIGHIINSMIENISANRINYELFLNDCISHFEDLIYEEKQIESVKDFLSLPQEAVYKIAQELYLYAKTEDEFSIEQKKI